MNFKERAQEDARKIILFFAAFIMILISSAGSEEFLRIENLQGFFQRLTGLCVLALALALPFAAGIKDVSAIGIYLLSISLSEKLRLSDWFSSEDLSVRLLILSSFPVFVGLLFSLWGRWISRFEDRILFLSIGLLLFFVGLSFWIKPALSPNCEAWFCGDHLLSARSVFYLMAPLILLLSVAAIRYFWPKFTWLGPVFILWIGSILLLFVTYEYEGLPLGAILATISIFLMYSFLEHTRLGISLLAWGSHQEAAKLSGISAKQVFAPAYFGLGFLASLASLMEFRNFDRSQFHEAGDIGLLALSALIIGGLALRRQRYVVNAVLSGVIFVAALELLWATQFQNQASFYAVLGVLVSLGVIVKR